MFDSKGTSGSRVVNSRRGYPLLLTLGTHTGPVVSVNSFPVTTSTIDRFPISGVPGAIIVTGFRPSSSNG
jgi:hypothetical protein